MKNNSFAKKHNILFNNKTTSDRIKCKSLPLPFSPPFLAFKTAKKVPVRQQLFLVFFIFYFTASDNDDDDDDDVVDV